MNNINNNDYDFSDTVFTLTINPSIYKENMSNLIRKMVVINEERLINFHNLSKVLAYIKIKELNIFSIDNNLLNTINITEVNNGCKIIYIEIKPDVFTKLLNYNGNNLLEYNKYSLYVLREGNYIGIKNLFSSINYSSVNLGRWRGSES
jgi:hypothetical protein